MLRITQEDFETPAPRPSADAVVHHKTVATAKPKLAARPEPFKEYRDVPGRPGWEEDGHGHQRYNGLPDALTRSYAEIKRLAGLDLARAEQTSLKQLQAFNKAEDAKHPNCRCALPHEMVQEFAKAQQQLLVHSPGATVPVIRG